MFAKLLQIGALLALSGAALAFPYYSGAGQAGQCNSGPVQCCDNVTTANALDAPTGDMLSTLLGLPIYDIFDNIATGCSPLVGGDNCGSTPVCCEHNNFGDSLINLACTPVSVPI